MKTKRNQSDANSNAKILSKIRRRMNKVIFNFETACGHEVFIDKAIASREKLMDFIRQSLEAKDAIVSKVRKNP